MLNINLYSVLASGQNKQKNIFFCCICVSVLERTGFAKFLQSPIWPAHAFSGEAEPACRSVGEGSPPAPDGWDGE